MTAPEQVRHNIGRAQAAYFGLVGLCLLMKPHALVGQSMCYFTTQWETAWLYTLAFVLFGAFTFRATWYLPRTWGFSALSGALKVLVILLVGVIATPYATSPEIEEIHRGFSKASFDLMFAISVGLTIRLRDRHSASWLALQLIAGLVTMFSLLGKLPFFFAGELAYIACFGILLRRALVRLL